MKNLFSYFAAVLAIVALLPLRSTAQTTETGDQTILELAQGNENLTILTRALQAAGLTDALTGDGPITVFAPTDQAFYGLPEGVLSALTKAENRDALVDILKYHVVDGELTASAVTSGIEGAADGMLPAETMNGELTAMLEGEGVALKDAAGRTVMVTQTDIMASNGVIHLIDGVLLPEGVDLEALTSGAEGMGMEETDGAMEEAGEAVDTAASATADAASTAYNETEEFVENAAETTAEAAETVYDETTEAVSDVVGSDDETMQEGRDDVRTVGSDVGNYESAPDATIVEVASGNSDFSTLVTAIESAELKDVLNSESGFTVFAPTNAAFDKVPADMRSQLMSSAGKTDLQNLLKYHVVASRIDAASLTKAIEKNNGYFRIQTLGGESLIASMQDGNVVLTDGNGEYATVTKTDVQASNGLIHAIDGVLTPRQ
ncbi:putative surface protein with fasciclin (FAS1) repeats [Neolewinella xylanilytica]|uniref:Putative surface protein with fasciclin (FAS1) repeats n=1 Tax=Neolewinella xylanilytica TaxID=1514080 RepID=A0A2S6I504_9BACT|nr:fasciclin domain-containing protein [Neolewinella xylanilytica]PPK86230.1 putative surface protein with fasciclin (FAS1) repeats [Neolewinella xylanilytica]